MPFFDVYIARAAFEKAEAHFKEEARKRLEAMGLLAGEVYSNNGKNFVLITDYITSENEASAISVRFTKNAFGELVKQFQSKNEKLLVGWFHSHPGYGCFLSQTDLATQRSYFQEDFNVALVGDPTKDEAGRMLMRAFRLKGGSYEELSHAIIYK